MDDDFSDFSSDAVNSAISGKPAPKSVVSTFDPNKSYGTPVKLLDNLQQTESGGDPLAVQKDTKAIGAYQFLPDTVAMLHKQGVKFNPFDAKESRTAADYYISQLAAQNGGDYSKAMSSYGGFKTKDSSGYLSKVLNGVTAQPAPTSQTTTPDEFSDFTSGDVHNAASPTSVEPYRIPDQPLRPTEGLPSATAKWWQYPAAGIEAGINTLGGVASVIPGALAVGTNGLNYAVRKLAGQDVSNAPPTEDAFQRGASIINGPLMENSSPLGQELTGDIAKHLEWMQALPGVGGELGMISKLAPGAIAQTKAFAGNAASQLEAGFQGMKQGYNARSAAEATPALTSAARTSGGAAATSLDSLVANSSPSLQAAYQAAKKSGVPLNEDAIALHVKADSLPVPVPLTAGQASGNVHLLSDEFNNRGKVPGLAERFDNQNQALKENLDAIREKAAPDVFAPDHVENGRDLINSYKAEDEIATKDVGQKYQALNDAAGGDFPIDTQAFVANADALLKKNLKSNFLPSGIKADLDGFRNGEPMSFEQFESMRTNLAGEMRKAERSGDGNASFASGLVRQALEDVPLTPEAAGLKGIADTARSAAKSRFDKIAADPAYKAAVNDSVAPDNFIDKFVIKGKKDDVATMRQNLANQSGADQTIAAGTVNWLKKQAGITGDQGNFRQAGFNSALESVRPKLSSLVDPQTAQHLSDLGDVSYATVGQKRGTYFNNSNTTVSALKSNAADVAETALNTKLAFAGFPFPGGTYIRKGLQNRAVKKAANESLKPGAGMTMLKDVGSE